MIAFSCPQCGMKFKVKTQFAGRASTCPTCKQRMQVPVSDKTIAPSGDLDGSDSSLHKAGVDHGVTLEQSAAASRKQPTVQELLAHRARKDGRYLLEREIARGGMGAVLRGVDCDLRREVAIKYLLDQTDPKKKLRFVEEAQITGQLEHPNIVPIHELGVDNQQRLFFTMKMVKGRSLAEVLDELRERPKAAEREWPLTRLLTILVSVCHALAYAHARGVVHRDLKPANIMVGDFGEVYVMDWGLAKVLKGDVTAPPLASVVSAPVAVSAAVAAGGSGTVVTARSGKSKPGRDGDADLTQDGAVLGTPVYMPPEQANGRLQDIDPRSDLYSLGAILYELLTLQPPVEKDGGYLAILMRVMQGEILPPEQRAPKRARAGKIPAELAAIARKALAQDKAQRYQTAEALRRDIERFQEGRSVSAKEDSKREMVWKFVKRNKGFSAGIAMSLLVMLLFMVLLLDSWQATRQALAKFTKEQDDRKAQMGAAVPAFIRAARFAINDRKFDDALIQLNTALEYKAENTEARMTKAQVLIALQRYGEAVETLERYLQIAPDDALARRLAELARQARPDDPKVLRELAGVLAKQNAYPFDEDLLRQVQRLTTSQGELQVLYRQRIEKAWPAAVNPVGLDPTTGQITVSLVGRAEVKDLQPLRDMRINHLVLDGCDQVRDLTPLKGMPLLSLSLIACRRVQDLGPLQGMPLQTLNLGNCTQLQDLTPLRGLPLTTLNLTNCNQVQDLAPLQGLKLTSLSITSVPARDLRPLDGMPLNFLAANGPQLPQIGPLKLPNLTSLTLSGPQVVDLTPVRSLTLSSLECMECTHLTDLRPLRGQKLTRLRFYHCFDLKDLSPLQGMPLTSFAISFSLVNDLSVLQGMPLTSVELAHLKDLRDLSALRGLKLTAFRLGECPSIQDITPLKGMPLTEVSLRYGHEIRDLTPLEGMNLQTFYLEAGYIKKAKGFELLRRMKNLTKINDFSMHEFWKKYDAGDFR